MPDITLPTPGVTPGPQYAQQINSAISAVNTVMETGRLSQSNLQASFIGGSEAAQIRNDTQQAFLLASTATFAPVDEAAAPQLRIRPSESNPILSVADTNLPSITWPCIVRVDGYLQNPLGKYYLYFSTDHAQADGHVELAYSDDLENWTVYGEVYRASSGTESETPHVIRDFANNRFIMYHQQVGPVGAVASQVTMYATSTDGVSWTQGGIALDVRNQNFWRAPIHTGYFRAFYVGNGYVGYSLMQGQEAPTYAIWYSRDGLTWTPDPRPLGYGQEYLPSGYRIDWSGAAVVSWRGRYHLLTSISSFGSGVEARTSYLIVAPLSSDFRSLVGPPQMVAEVSAPWEYAGIGAAQAFVDEGRLVVVWASGAFADPDHPQAFGIGFVEASAVGESSLPFGELLKTYSLSRDPSGGIVPAGRVEHRFSWSPLLSTVAPGDFSVSAGTLAIQDASSSTNAPNYLLSTAATINSAARLQINKDIQAGFAEEIEFSIQGLRFSDDGGFDFSFDLQNTAGTAGVNYYQANGEVGGHFRTHNGSAGVNYDRVPYFAKSDGAGRRPTNWTLRWRPPVGEIYILMDDQVMASCKYPLSDVLLSSPIRAMITLNNRVAAVRSARFHTVSLTYRHN